MTDGTNEIGIQQLSAAIEDGIRDADFTRAAGLAALLELQLARTEQLSTELELRRTVDAQDPRVAVLERRVASGITMLRNLDREVARAATPTPPAEADGWILHGRIISENGDLPKGVRVILQNQKEQPLEGSEPARVDTSGFFTARVPVPVPGDDASKRGAAEQPVDSVQVTVVVMTAGEQELARRNTGLTPEAGIVNYVEILVGEDTTRVSRESGGPSTDTPSEELDPDATSTPPTRKSDRSREKKEPE
jgi:hypothetical protein